jgi:hypothetical protein
MTTLSCRHPRTAPSQGDCVRIQADDQLYQVIGIDDRHDRCWLRRWPLTRQGSEVFEISLQQVRPATAHHT